MADRPIPHQLQVHPQRYEFGFKTQKGGPQASKVLAVMVLLPVGGSLLGLAGISLVGSLIGLAVLTPLFLIFSPVLVPAAIATGLALTGFLASGAFGVTALTSLSWVVKYLRQAKDSIPQQLEEAKKKMEGAGAQAGQKTKEVGQTIQSKTQEGGK